MTSKNIISVRVGNSSSRPYENIMFYKDNQIIYQINSQGMELRNVKDNRISSVNRLIDGELVSILIHEPRQARKLDLTKKDNFIYKTISNYSYFCKKYDLYIYCGAGGDAVLEYVGEYVASSFYGETNYQKAYNLEFINGINVDIFHYDRYMMEDPETYKLQPGERFSECYGSKENPCIWPFDNKDHETLFKKLHPEQPWIHQKGIAKKWHEVEQLKKPILVTGYGYSRTEKTEERKNREDLAAVISKALNKTISHYDIERMLEVVNITLK